MNEGTTKKCPICGRPYKTWPYYAGDQSACPSCVREAENNSKGPTFHIEPLVECDNTDELLVAIDCALAPKESEQG